MNEKINDFEKALDNWGMVVDANDLTWIRDENECVRFWTHGDCWSIPAAHYQPAPPFTNAYAEEATE